MANDHAMNESYGTDYVIGPEQLEEDSYTPMMKGKDYSTVNGISYRLKECGVATKMGYDNGNHTLSVRNDQMGLATESLIETGDELSYELGQKLNEKHFKKNK